MDGLREQKIFPLLGRINPLIKRNKVVLPLPFSPTNIHKPGFKIEKENCSITLSPLGQEKETLSNFK